MRTPRETIAIALFHQLRQMKTATTPFKVMDRRVVPWDESNDWPALYLQQFDDTPSTTHLNLTRWSLNFMCWIYLPVDTESEKTTDTKINLYKDALEAAVTGQFPGMPQTLGGLVENVLFSGTISTLPGLVKPPAVIAAPISVICGI